MYSRRMKTYAERLLWSMKNHEPQLNQSEIAKLISDRIGKRITPQSVQHLCDTNKNAQGSIHTTVIAEILGVDAIWLAYGIGNPVRQEPKILDIDSPEKTTWPFESITFEQYMSLSDAEKLEIDNHIGYVYSKNLTHQNKKAG